MTESKDYTNDLRIEISRDYLYPRDIAYIIQKYYKHIIDGKINFYSLSKVNEKYTWYNFCILTLFLPHSLSISYIDRLIEGFQDFNWPGSAEIYVYLSFFNTDILVPAFRKAIDRAIKKNDLDWLYWLLSFMSDKAFIGYEAFNNEGMIDHVERFMIAQGQELPQHDE